MTYCLLCDPQLGPVLSESPAWRIVLNRNQNLLGKCLIATRRHIEAVPVLSGAEWQDLHRQLARTTRELEAAFQPDHFNYAFLQNQDRHVHLHVIPRYASARTFAGRLFEDPDYPDHYAVPAPTDILTPEQTAVVVEDLRRRLAQAGTSCEGEQ